MIFEEYDFGAILADFRIFKKNPHFHKTSPSINQAEKQNRGWGVKQINFVAAAASTAAEGGAN
jgi:hypothetical protein